jgi:hypothetical protein
MANDAVEGASVEKEAKVARFEVFSAVLLKIHVFWDATPCTLVMTDVLMYHVIFIFMLKHSKLLFLGSLT